MLAIDKVDEDCLNSAYRFSKKKRVIIRLVVESDQCAYLFATLVESRIHTACGRVLSVEKFS